MSPVTGGAARCFATVLSREQRETLEQRVESAIEQSRSMDCDYVAFLRIDFPNTVVVEMLGHMVQRHMVFQQVAPRAEGATLVPARFSPQVMELLCSTAPPEHEGTEFDLGLHFVPSEPIPHVHRNALCPCGSGARYKDCHRPVLAS